MNSCSSAYQSFQASPSSGTYTSLQAACQTASSDMNNVRHMPPSLALLPLGMHAFIDCFCRLVEHMMGIC